MMPSYQGWRVFFAKQHADMIITIKVFNIFTKKSTMSLLNQNNKKGKKKDNKKSAAPSGHGSKFIQKPKTSGGFVSKQANTGSQRGS